MSIPGDYDGTLDSLLVINSTAHTVGSATTSNGSTLTLPAVAGEYTLHIEVTACSTAVGDCAILNVNGSTSSTFASGNHLLASYAFGAAAIIGTQIGGTNTGPRGTGSYSYRFSNVAFDNTAAPVVLPYIRIQVKTVGVSSGVTYTASLTQVQ